MVTSQGFCRRCVLWGLLHQGTSRPQSKPVWPLVTENMPFLQVLTNARAVPALGGVRSLGASGTFLPLGAFLFPSSSGAGGSGWESPGRGSLVQWEQALSSVPPVPMWCQCWRASSLRHSWVLCCGPCRSR